MNSLRFHILLDEFEEKVNSFHECIKQCVPKRFNRVSAISTGEAAGIDSDGRIWVELDGEKDLKMCVTHLHPANPVVAESIARKLAPQGDGDEDNMFTGEDDISLASLEDYWFNHWQGPFITADSNQNSLSLRRSRRSLRRSKRKFRCSICQKRIRPGEQNPVESLESQVAEEEDVLAHLPSIKLEARSPKLEDSSGLSSDEEGGMMPAISEEALSRYSASDEHLARAHRIVDNEIRTSFSLFADQQVAQDVVDGVSMHLSDGGTVSPEGASKLPPPLSPRISRSCPCSPKQALRNQSPKSNNNSPKPRSRAGSSKFSLSSSLLAIPRHAANTLMADFLKSESGKSESHQKLDSCHTHLKSESLKHDLSPSTPKAHSSENVSTKTSLHVSQSMPAMKLSKMSMTYRAGAIVSCEKEFATPPISEHYIHENNAEEEQLEGACALPEPSHEEDESQVSTTRSFMLPDVVPRWEATDTMTTSNSTLSASSLATTSSPVTSAANTAQNTLNSNSSYCLDNYSVPAASSAQHGLYSNSSYYVDNNYGVINLGFDGQEESSDFQDLNQEVYRDAPLTQAMELLPANSQADRRQSTDGADSAEYEGVNNGHNGFQMNLNKAHAISIGHASQGQENALALEVPCNSEDAADVEGGAQERDHTSEENLDFGMPRYRLKDLRALLFWWQEPKNMPPQNDDLDFCPHHTQSKVQQKPLLFFIHSIGGSSDQWTQQLWYFVCCGYEVVAPDMLGHGLSSAPHESSEYSFQKILDNITLVFDLFVPQGRRCIVIGHGYGCSFASALARGRPCSVKSLAMISCGGPSPLIPYAPGSSFPVPVSLITVLKPFLACCCSNREILYSPRGKHFQGAEVSPTPCYVLQNTSKGQDWPEGDVLFHRRITVPTLLVHGMKDNKITLVDMCEMERTIPRAFLELVPGAGHDVMTDTPYELCLTLHRFIKRWSQHAS
ncbi:uncharacterized protein LOC143020378 isoform X1 [Oratosquilla oratoria]|uniref:uncharacterized protein LOC143020378 isoform X1 n=1 Tax=Oratosquilla oratoria TaxID=337810 RepID=UPI003F76BC3C